jgi:HKD family nuclease
MDEWIGLHERLWTPALARWIAALGLTDQQLRTAAELPSEQAAPMLAAHLARLLQQGLATLTEAERPAWQQALDVLGQSLAEAGPPLAGLVDELPTLPLRLLTEVLPAARAQLKAADTPRPDVPLCLSALLTGSRHSPSLLSQLEKELASADRADWLESFIKFSGIRPLREVLQRFTAQPTAEGGARLRVATTSYLGATDPAALQFLLELPNTEVRVSFDTHRTRLHAKAYLFHRRTGFGTAYVGSANVSRVALDEGLEWTARISQHELPHLWRQLTAGFALHWEDPAEFETLTRAELPRFMAAVRAERGEREADVLDVIDWCLAGLRRGPGRCYPHLSGALRLRAHYTREQILIALGVWRYQTSGFSNNGVIHLKDCHADAFFVTLDKDPQRFSPTTMYHDDALSADRFHWQTPTATGVDTPVGQRYLHHAERGYTPLLFVRHAAKQPDGLTAPFCYLGPLAYLRHEGDRPISIVWQLWTPMPAGLYEQAHRHAI